MFQFVADTKKYRSLKINQRGMTLIEVLVTVAIAAIVMTSIATMMSDIFKAQRTVQSKDANRDIVQAIRELLTDPLICKASFGGGDPNGAGFSKTQIVDSAVPANIKYQTGVQYLNNLVTITSFKVKDYAADNAAVTSQIGKAELTITMNKVGATVGGIEMRAIIILQINLDASNTIAQCYSIGGADWLWRISPADMADIYYKGGNVGIGTSTPRAHLHIAGNATGLAQVKIYQDSDDSVGLSILRDASSTGSQQAVLQFCNEDTVGANSLCSYLYQKKDIGGLSMTVVNSQTHVLDAAVFDNPSLHLDTNGKVGVGTTTPWSNLHVKGAQNSNSFAGVVSESTANGAPGFCSVGPGGSIYGCTGGVGILGHYGVVTGSVGDYAISANANIRFVTGFSPSWTLAGNGVSNTKMSILANGNVGIGIASPPSYAALDVDTSNFKSIHTMDIANGGLLIGYQGSTIQARTTTDGNDQNLILQKWGGNLGIGDVSPTSIITAKSARAEGVWPGGGDALVLESSSGVHKAYLGVDNNTPWVGSLSNESFKIVANQNTAITIQSDGNVGIGTPPTTAKLEVAGGIKPGSATKGSSCSPEGAFAYDAGAHMPVYCSNSGVWTLMGGCAGSLVDMYRCSPPSCCPGGGAWYFSTCNGQITSLSSCSETAYPCSCTVSCTPVGKMCVLP
jgi:prepilin-type N-terminal cleavage/methylation domain-containing protein